MTAVPSRWCLLYACTLRGVLFTFTPEEVDGMPGRRTGPGVAETKTVFGSGSRMGSCGMCPPVPRVRRLSAAVRRCPPVPPIVADCPPVPRNADVRRTTATETRQQGRLLPAPCDYSLLPGRMPPPPLLPWANAALCLCCLGECRSLLPGRHASATRHGAWME